MGLNPSGGAGIRLLVFQREFDIMRADSADVFARCFPLLLLLLFQGVMLLQQ